MDDVRMVELLHDFAAPFELAFAAPREAKLRQQDPQNQALIELVRNQINVCHPTAVDLFQNGEVGESRANHCVETTVTNRAVVCKRNPRKSNDGRLDLAGGQREVIRRVLIADVAYHATKQLVVTREFAIDHVATNEIAEDTTEILVPAVTEETA
jgi:hypothetical protein